ncbi:hypothetical protein L3Y34_012799 [Caenorhabditis briggsae]|uniref:Uncharacterized protein n=1 Tax=Caenorhabditis briggsae TaxID=6238 RepID=A0AAE8ZSA7_CAEBR|nr:hypothetical protein L3Y34_012799 [Caenorhabditis briggsae]
MCKTINKKYNLHKCVRIIWQRNLNCLPPKRKFTETSMNNYVCCSRNSSAVQSTDTSGNQEKATASNKEDLALAEQEASPSNDSPRMMTRYRKRLSDTATLAIDIKHNRRSMSSNSQPEAVSRQQLVTSLGTPDFFTNGLQYFGMTK